MKSLSYIILAVAVLLAVSCVDTIKDDTSSPSLSDAPLRFNVDVYPITRSGIDDNFQTSWTAGDAIGVYAVEFGNGLSADNCVISNARLEYNGTEWLLDGASESLWPSDSALDFYAYYPYDESYSDPLDMTFSVASDQSDPSAHNGSDLMLAKVSGVARGAEVSLMFRHVLSLVDVTYPSLASGNDDIDVFLYDMAPDVRVDLSSATVAPGQADGTDVQMYLYAENEDSYVYRAWVPSQVVDAGTPVFMYRYFDFMDRYDTDLDEDLALDGGSVAVLSSVFPSYIPVTYIKAGSFLMGTPESEDGHSSREIQHNVTISEDFYMGTYEITNSQYAEFLNATGVIDPGGDAAEVHADVEGYGDCAIFQKSEYWNVMFDSSLEKWLPVEGREEYPVSFVTWYGTKAFADWAGAELPTEAQWEYACRAGTETAWSFGDDHSVISQYAWCDENSDGGPSPVGTKLPNPWGLYDMHGNLYEWCSDWFDNDYGIEDLTSETSVTDPTGPDPGMYKVIRGGSWLNYWYYCRSGYRNVYFPNYVSDLAGFRVVFKTK